MIEHAYIHIPFCRRKCNYCAFVSGLNIEAEEIYINALLKEIGGRYNDDKLKTLYIGGGTPSLLKAVNINKIVKPFNFADNYELTIEANPETISKDKCKSYLDAGINRISLGVQAFNNNILDISGRKHSEKDIYQAVENIKSSGFKNISIDLIYGLPFQTTDDFMLDLKKAVNLNIEHISAYGLKIEKNSYFGRNPPQSLPDDDMQADMYLMLCEFLRQNKFIHYEISNFSRHNFYSRHNSAYWKNKNYYGFGLNASGYEKNARYKNTSDFNKYINQEFMREETTLTEEEILEEEIFLALRLKKGININKINKKFNIDFEKKYASVIKKYRELLIIKNNYCFLTENGFLVSNNIMSEFINQLNL